MKKVYCILSFLLTWGLQSYSQSTEQQVISSSGNHYNNGNIQLSYTIGEPVVSTESNSTITLTQGFHQTNWTFVGLEDFAPEIVISVFPNPVTSQLNIQSNDFSGVTYQLFDSNGKLVIENRLTEVNTQLSTENLSPAMYSIVFLNQDKTNLKTLKLIKNH